MVIISHAINTYHIRYVLKNVNPYIYNQKSIGKNNPLLYFFFFYFFQLDEIHNQENLYIMRPIR